MKTFLKTALYSALVFLLSIPALDTFGAVGGGDSGKLSFAVAIPDSWNSFVQRTDYGNQTIFSFATPDDDPVFLFSVTKVTDEQWNQLQGQLEHYDVIKNENGYITYVQRTALTDIKGVDDHQFHSMSLMLDAVINSIIVNQ
jgi:hypothetical protein